MSSATTLFSCFLTKSQPGSSDLLIPYLDDEQTLLRDVALKSDDVQLLEEDYGAPYLLEHADGALKLVLLTDVADVGVDFRKKQIHGHQVKIQVHRHDTMEEGFAPEDAVVLWR